MYIQCIYLNYMNTKIQKWGNSLGIRLPKEIANNQALTAGSVVKVSTEDQKIIIEKVSNPRFTIESLVAGINKDNLHAETDWGEPRGKEIW